MEHNKETYVSVHTATLLKQAGFDWETRASYWFDYTISNRYILTYPKTHDDWNHRVVEDIDYISAPTLAVSQRWLREIKKYEIVVEFDFDSPFGEKCYYAEYVDTRTNGERRYYHNIVEDEYFKAYEGALEFGIKKCLELIIEETKREQQ